MIFSKSFGYAVRGVLYIASVQSEKKLIQAEEIAAQLSVPRHFMGKVLKLLAKQKVIFSVKGPFGGFTINDKTLATPLIKIVEITDGLVLFKSCVLRFKDCSALNPCPLHFAMAEVKNSVKDILANTTFHDLLHADQPGFLAGLTSGVAPFLPQEGGAASPK